MREAVNGRPDFCVAFYVGLKGRYNVMDRFYHDSKKTNA
jgi:hypothetical protein